MVKNWKASPPWLRRKAKRGFHGYPVATIAFYGPTASLATKVVVSIVREEGRDPDPLERWFSENIDVRNDPAIGDKILAFLKDHDARSVIVTGDLIGCPHEEGIDSPRENPARIVPTGLGATGSRASVFTEPQNGTLCWAPAQAPFLGHFPDKPVFPEYGICQIPSVR